MIDLYSIHEKKSQEGLLTIHPSRWLYSGRQLGRGGVFDLLSRGVQAIRVGDQMVEHFRQLCDVGLASKIRHKRDYYFATSEIAERYFEHVPRDRGIECAVRDMLSVWNPAGQHEVHTPVGYIDLLLPAAIVEVKSFAKWKHALGQVLAYSSYYSDRNKIIHLYVPGAQRPELREQRRVCAQFNVEIVYQNVLASPLGPMSRLGETVGGH